MTNIVVLNNQTHRTLRVQVGAAANLGDNQHFVQVTVREFPFLVAHYPILLSKDSSTGAFYCGAMLGIDKDENLFLDGGDTYRPLNLQRVPFHTVGSDLAIDLDSPRVGQNKGEPLFDENGEPTPYLKSIMATFLELRSAIEMTKVFIESLMKLKLVEPIDIDVGFDDGTKRDLVGLYTVNQDTLKRLPDATVIDLFRRGYLQLIYLMIASLKQVPVLAQKKNRRLLQAGDGN